MSNPSIHLRAVGRSRQLAVERHRPSWSSWSKVAKVKLAGKSGKSGKRDQGQSTLEIHHHPVFEIHVFVSAIHLSDRGCDFDIVRHGRE